MLYFCLREMTFLRYFVPLAQEAKRKNIESTFIFGHNGKYNNPIKVKNFLLVQSLGFNTVVWADLDLNDIKIHDSIIMVEGVDLPQIKHLNCKKVSLSYMTDFRHLYKKYKDDVDHIILPPKCFTERFIEHKTNNHYIGSTKYDKINIQSMPEDIQMVGSERLALVFFPRRRDLGKIDMLRLYEHIRSKGYKVVVKTRGKDPVTKGPLRGDYYFTDDSWFPHTSMQLLDIVDVVVNTGSTGLKEAINANIPTINVEIKPHNVLEFIYNDSLNISCVFKDFKTNFDKLLDEDYHKDWLIDNARVKQKYIKPIDNVSAEILRLLYDV